MTLKNITRWGAVSQAFHWTTWCCCWWSPWSA